jgi:hypothetical protein
MTNRMSVNAASGLAPLPSWMANMLIPKASDGV